MESIFSKVLDALQIQLHKVNLRKVTSPVFLNGSLEVKNVLIQLRKGDLFVGENYAHLKPGDCYFVPVSQPLFAKFSKSAKYTEYGQEGFQEASEREKYIAPISLLTEANVHQDVFSIVRFDVTLYNVVSLFEVLETPGFVIEKDDEINTIIQKLIEEEEGGKIGKTQMMRTLTEQLVIKLFRCIEVLPNSAEYMEKLDYMLDRRLVNIIKFIQENLENDLSNKAIAQIAYVSEDYVGQFFKSLTKRNLQEYVENQRLERAYHLLRTRSDIVQEIAFQVGFKDPAYFSRRFKMRYGVNANTIRKRESVLSNM
jgi:AraC-like DNA-binding protein